MKDSVFDCDSDVHIAHPFPADDRIWSFWAGLAGDCGDYSLLLTVVLDKEATLNLLGYIGADLTGSGCRNTYYFSESVACEWELKPGDKFGMLFKGDFKPIFHTTEW